MAKDSFLKIGMDPEIKEKFAMYCKRYGISQSAMAAYIVGNWVYGQEKLADPVIEQLMEKLKDSIGEKINEATKNIKVLE